MVQMKVHKNLLTETIYMNSEIELMQNEVDSVATQIEEICKTDKEINDLYMGTQIYFSPLQSQMDIMFIGINPGAGSFKHSENGKKPHKIEPLENSEYETEEYSLQREWTSIFGKDYGLNNLNLLYKSFKTNCCFIATENSEKLKKLKSKLKYTYKLDLAINEKKWIKTLIDYVEPKIIICEGFEAFNYFTSFFSDKELKFSEGEEWTNRKVAYLISGCIILGFKRIYSTLESKDNVAATILEKMEDANII